ncbi:MAG TPA: mechanosensitive ion channel family protein [Terriglobales bacterium]
MPHWHWLPYPIPVIGTALAIAVAVVLHFTTRAFLRHGAQDDRESYRRRKFANTVIAFAAGIAVVILWARELKQTGTFLGLIGAGLAVALKEPLLSIAGRLAIFSGHMFNAGDRIELQKMSGDVIDIGFFYMRVLEIGSWIGGDQYSGRILLIPNSMIFGTPIMNYTEHLSMIWDEVHLPITYQSNMEEANRILTEVGDQYTREFLKNAEKDVEQMRRRFLMPELDLKPQVYLKVTSNWLQLTMRYLVDPKQRRSASSFIYKEVFHRVSQAKDIQIASETMDLTVHRPKAA